ncbi:hypothetical protein D0Z07_6851 [Hyphodiscus hymeniophilus]|uniref:Glycosyltransferase family 69 protein n=1 Tax=Hyphodiscus hymeniophilus TaxID=353542 RepID=A0A9P6VGR0_9HELO|nr:hypothetical protein D0Z07_6851 [Hyphodiscus hymeniophilus]
MAIQYDPLPRSSSDLEDHVAFKDKPRRRSYRISAFLRKARRCCRPLHVFIALLIFISWQILFNASYTNSPPFTIDAHEIVYIAANIIDGDLIKSSWGKSLLELIDLIGKDRVFVSIYGGPSDALKELEAKLPCEHSVVSQEDDPIPLNEIPHTKLPTGESRIKRIAYLAEVRNKALAPLDTLTKKYDRVLFINDVFFNPMDAGRLLWGTNLNAEGKAEYKAVCGTDFVTSWKYYDTFATRDLEGYSIGVPIFPWFSAEGDAITRKDVLAGKDAVRVKSCWGGMVAFDGRYLQRDLKSLTGGKTSRTDTVGPPTLPLRFRSEPEPFVDSSECCLIHADIIALPTFPSISAASEKDSWGDGIFMNPYVRVAYDSKSFSRIWLAKRFERLFALPQGIINRFAHMPVFNPRRAEIEGQIIQDRLWISSDIGTDQRIDPEFGDVDNTWQGSNVAKRDTIGSGKGKEFWDGEGHFIDFERTAGRGGYCGVRQLLVLKEGHLVDGEGNWDNLRDVVPPLEV